MENKFLKIVIILLLMYILCINIVSAAGFSATITPSSSNVEQSSEFNVIISIKNIDIDNGINSLSGTLEYNKSVFETINASSIEGINSWQPQYDQSKESIVLTKTTFAKEDEQVFQITFKTKSNIKAGTAAEIKFKNIKASNSEKEVDCSDISTKITVGQVAGNTANVTNNTSSNAIVLNVANKVPNNVTRNEQLPSYVNMSSNNTEEDIPYTGVEDTIMFLVVTVVIIAIVFYIKFEKINQQMK